MWLQLKYTHKYIFVYFSACLRHKQQQDICKIRNGGIVSFGQLKNETALMLYILDITMQSVTEFTRTTKTFLNPTFHLPA